MPAYNAGKFLPTSIESVLNQTLRDWELLIINDGSTDDTEYIIKTYNDPRIRYFYQNNQGVSATRNVGLKQMSGEYFCFLDADDYFPPESLEIRYKKLKQNPEIDFLDGEVDIFNHNLKRKLDHWKPSLQGNPLNQLLNLSDSCFWGLTWMIRRSNNKVYPFHENLSHGEDLLFFIELAQSGGRYDFVEDVILHYRKGHTSAMKNLKGLEKGYHYIYKSFSKNEKISANQAGLYKKIAGSIIFKSYLGKYQMYNALLSLVKKW